MQSIFYQNRLKKSISVQQANLLDSYYMTISENGIPIVKKSIYKSKLDYVTFYNPQNLNLSEAITFISQEYPETPFEILQETTYGAYKICTYLAYDRFEGYDGKRIELVDSNNYTLCVEDYDEIEEIYKYALDSNGKEIIFHYSKIDRSFHFASGAAGNSFNPNIGLEDFEIKYPGFMSANPYYQDGTFIPN